MGPTLDTQFLTARRFKDDVCITCSALTIFLYNMISVINDLI